MSARYGGCGCQVDLGIVANETTNVQVDTYATVLTLSSLPHAHTPAYFNGTVLCSQSSWIRPVPLGALQAA